MHAPAAGQALHALGDLDDLLDVGVLVVHAAELGRLRVALVLGVEDPVDRDVLAHHRRRQRLGDLVPHREGVVEHAGGVLDGVLRLHDAVGDDLGDLVVAVLLLDVLDDLAAAAIIEVDVEVGHGDAVRVQEPLEEQAVLDRVEVGDAHGVGDHRAGARATAGADADPLLLGPLDVVGDDQEVAGEAHLEDDPDLVVGALLDLVGDAGGVAVVQAVLDLLDEPRLLVLPARGGEVRHVVRALGGGGEGDVAHLGDAQGVVAGLGELAEQLPHLLGGLQEVAGAAELEAVGIVQARAGVDAQQHVLDGGVLLGDVVEVVGRHQRGVHRLGDLEQVLGHALLDVEAVVHQLDEVAVPAEHVLELAGGLHGLVELSQPQAGLHLAGGAAGGGDQARRVLREDLAVHPRPLAHLPVEGGGRAEAEEVVHALGRLRQQGHVGVGAAGGDVVARRLLLLGAPLHAGAVMTTRPGSHIGLDADDGLDPGVGRGLVELVGAEEIAVVGDRHRLLALVHRLGDQLVDLRGTVQQRVVGVDVEMDEVIGTRRSHAHQRSRAGRRASAQAGVGEVTPARPARRESAGAPRRSRALRSGVRPTAPRTAFATRTRFSVSAGSTKCFSPASPQQRCIPTSTSAGTASTSAASRATIPRALPRSTSPA